MSQPRNGDFPNDVDPATVPMRYTAEIYRVIEQQNAQAEELAKARDERLYKAMADTEKRLTEGLGNVSKALRHLSERVDALDGRTNSIEEKDREAEQREEDAAREAAIEARVAEARKQGHDAAMQEAGWHGNRPMSNPSILVDAHGHPMPSSMPAPDPEATDGRGMMLAIDTRPAASPVAPSRPIAEGVGALLAAMARVVDVFADNFKMLGALIAIITGLLGGGTALTVLGIQAYQETLAEPAAAPAPAPAPSRPSPDDPTVLPRVWDAMDAMDLAEPSAHDTVDTGDTGAGDGTAAGDTSRSRAR